MSYDDGWLVLQCAIAVVMAYRFVTGTIFAGWSIHQRKGLE